MAQFAWGRPIKPKPDNQISKNQMIKYFWPYDLIGFTRCFLYRSPRRTDCKEGGQCFNVISRYFTKCKVDRILGSKQYFWPYVLFCCFGPMVIFIYLFGHLVFYLFGPLDSVYWTSSICISVLFKSKSSAKQTTLSSIQNTIWQLDQYSWPEYQTSPLFRYSMYVKLNRQLPSWSGWQCCIP